MRIQHNIAALNSYRQLSGNNSAVAKNLEKLSSGYKINRAGDDAAGLAISEKMRAQITGLETAQKNANDGISLVQTAEGALTEVHSMLNRMVELADQSANGTYDNETDRANLQKEVKSLLDEVDRIADSTNFNGINLLDGSLSTTELNVTNATIGNNPVTPTTTPASGAISQVTMKEATVDTGSTLKIEYADANGKLHSVDVEYKGDKAGADKNATAVADALAKNGELSSIFDIKADGAKVNFTSKVTGATGAKVMSVSSTDNATATLGTPTAGADAKVTVNGLGDAAAGDKFTLNGKTYEFVADTAAKPTTEGATAIVVGKDNASTVANINKALEKEGVQATQDTDNVVFSAIQNGKGLTLQIGDTADDFNQLTVSVGNMKAKSLGIADVDISTQAGAQAAVSKIKDAINSVSSTRGDLGAIQNRLEHTINNLSVTTENMTAAESRIRDTDMAKEMMAYTKNNILVQAAQAMLAQANQVPQGVLQLLQ
mgnify:CR=1 FL=1